MIRILTTAVLLAGFASMQAANAQSNRVSGQFNFPPGFTANQGEVKFKVSTDPLSVITVNEEEQETSTIVTFERFARFSTYSIVLKDDPEVAGPQPVFEDFQLNFECVSGCPQNFLLTTIGYWDSVKGVVDKSQGEVFSSASAGQVANPTINIELDRADVFSGSIAFPDGSVAVGDEKIELTVIGSAISNQPTFSQIMSPAKDASEIEFAIGVPRLSNVGGWNLELRCTDCGSDIESVPHYPTTASGNPISLSQDDSFFFRKFLSFSNLSLTLVSSDKPPAAQAVGAFMLLLED